MKNFKRKIKTAQKIATNHMGTLYSKMNRQLLYGVSVIVPFYNAGQTLIDTCESLLNQKGIEELTLEVLLIDNNSSDESTQIAKDFARNYPTIFRYLFCGEQGVSNARNFGLDKARAKFITFLDADDMFSQTVIRDGFRFFSNHSAEIDIVFFPRFFMYVDGNGKKTYKPHHRNKLFNGTGVYDERKHNHALYFTSPNIMIKNNQPYRFEKGVPYGEDMLFITNFLSLNPKIGFVKSAHYNYRFSAFSTVDKYLSPTASAYLILDNMDKQFAPYLQDDLPIPKQVQSLAFNEIAWRYKSLENRLFPYHLDEKEFRSWEIRLRNLLRHIDDEIILHYPNLDNFHKYSILLMKEEPIKLALFESLEFRKQGIQIHEEQHFETIITDFNISDQRLSILGFLKAKLGELYNADVFVSVNGLEQELPTWQSVSSLYNKRDRSNDFTAFRFDYDLRELGSDGSVDIYIYYKVDGILFTPKKYWHAKNRLLDINRKSLNYDEAIKMLASNTIDGVRIELLSNFHLVLTAVSEDTQKADFDDRTKRAPFHLRELREQSKELAISAPPVWLYVDNFNVIDNAFYQYLNDYLKEDGISRYYVYKSDFRYVHEYLSKEHIPFEHMNFVKYQSSEHKKLMLQTQFILGSFNEYHDVIVPFDTQEMLALSDVLDFKFVYLQHGVLHSKQPQTYDIERTFIDKIVISSDFERTIFTEELHYPDDSLLQVGMSRFDIISSPKEKQARILFAPSFRHSFVGDLNHFDANGNRLVNKDIVLHSRYYDSLVKLAKSKSLNDYLHLHDLHLDVKLHPIFTGISEILSPLFEQSDRIHLINEQIDSSNYLIFVTDFSSYAFDAVNIRQPIIYYELDREEFACGNHHYRELYMDFEFGDVVDTVDAFIASIDTIAANDFQVSPKYLEKMNTFYHFPDHSREALYGQLCEMEVGHD